LRPVIEATALMWPVFSADEHDHDRDDQEDRTHGEVRTVNFGEPIQPADLNRGEAI